MVEARLIAGKLAEKLKRSKAVLLSQHIGRAMLGFQKLGEMFCTIATLANTSIASDDPEDF